MDEALFYILQEKELEYVTVKEICKRAGVNRSTFYLHYQGVADLLEECLEQLRKRFRAQFSGVLPGNFPDDLGERRLDELVLVSNRYLVPYLEFVRDNRHVFRATFNSPRSLRAREQLAGLSEYVIAPIMQRFGWDEKERRYRTAFYISGLVAIVREWIGTGCKEPVEGVAQIMIECCMPARDKQQQLSDGRLGEV